MECIGWILAWILQGRILEWVAFPFSRGSSQPRDGTQVSGIAGRFFANWPITHLSYFNFLFPPSYMVLQERVKRIIQREARRVFLGTSHKATRKPWVTGLPAWLRIILHSDFSPGTPLAQSTNPLFSFALESDVKVTVHCSFIKNIFQYYREYILLPPYWKSQADTEMDKTDVLEETRKILRSIVYWQKRFFEQHGYYGFVWG